MYNIYIPNLWGGCILPQPVCRFSFKNLEVVKAVTVAFCYYSNISLDTSVPNLVSLNYSSLQLLDKTQTGVFWGKLGPTKTWTSN